MNLYIPVSGSFSNTCPGLNTNLIPIISAYHSYIFSAFGVSMNGVDRQID